MAALPKLSGGNNVGAARNEVLLKNEAPAKDGINYKSSPDVEKEVTATSEKSLGLFLASISQVRIG